MTTESWPAISARLVLPQWTRVGVSIVSWGIMGGLVGWLAWGQAAGINALLLVLALPVGYGLARSRVAGWSLMLGYYLAGARGLPGGAGVFFGDQAEWWAGWGLWFSACLILSAPFALLWGARGQGWRFMGAVILVTLPPVGLIGWCSPLAVGGVLLPGMRWGGVALAVGLLGTLADRGGVKARLAGVAAVGLVAVLGNVGWVAPQAPVGWRGIDTEFSRLSSGAGGRADAGELLGAMARMRWLRELAGTVPKGWTLVLPETLLGPVGAMAEFELQVVDEVLVKRGARMLVGAEVPVDAKPGQYFNGLMVVGVDGVDEYGRHRVLKQGIPVPVSMWQPWAGEGAIADLWGRGAVLDVGGVKAGVVICYEQLLPWSMLLRAAERPRVDVLVAASNVWWAKGTSIPVIQEQTVRAFSRMFGMAVVGAVNG